MLLTAPVIPSCPGSTEAVERQVGVVKASAAVSEFQKALQKGCLLWAAEFQSLREDLSFLGTLLDL